MNPLNTAMMSEADAVVHEARALEWETRRDLDAVYGADPAAFMESQMRYDELRQAAEMMVAVLYRMQDPLATDAYTGLAGRLMPQAQALLGAVQAGELVQKTSLAPAGAQNAQ